MGLTLRWGRGAVMVVAAALAMLAVTPVVARASFVWQAVGLADQTDGIPLSAASCPASDQCTALDGHGDEVTFNPGSPSGATLTTIAPGQAQGGIACPSTSLCVVAGAAGIITFNPAAPNAVTTTPTGSLSVVACPSVTQCTAIGGGSEITFDPAAPALKTPVSVDAGEYVSAIVCPVTNQCTAVDGNGDEVTFDPGNPGGASVNQIDTINNPDNGPEGVALAAVACPDITQCTAVDDSGNQVSFEPSPFSARGPTNVPGMDSYALIGVTCPKDDSCAALSANGRVATYDPKDGSGSGSTSALAGALNPVALTCAGATQCTAVGAGGLEQTFALSPYSASPAAVVAHGGSLTGVACASPSECTAMGGTAGLETFDPTSPGTVTPDPVSPMVSTAGPPEIACPAVSECVATDIFGNTETFDPGAPADAVSNTLGQGGYGVSCPAANQCTAVGEGGETTFDPAPFTVQSSHTIASGKYLEAVACPSTEQCTAVDQSGDAVTFDPSGFTTTATEKIDGTDPLHAIVCPTTTECVALSYSNGAVQFAPIGAATNLSPPETPTLTSVACVSAGDCLITTAGGQVLEGNPQGSAGFTAEPLPGANSAEGIACPTTAVCVAVDEDGRAFTGYRAPVNTAAPGITGTAEVGQVLTEAHGSWSVPPTGYTYQWEDCDAAGAHCAAIPGATAQTYTLTATDSGHTIEVQEVAANGPAPSAASSSAATGIVPSSPGPTSPPGTTMTGTGPGAPGGSSRGASGPSITALRTRGNTATVTIRCSGAGGVCAGKLTFTSAVPRAHKAAAAKPPKRVAKPTVVVASARYKVPSGAERTYRLKLNAVGARFLARSYRLAATLKLSGAPSEHRSVKFSYGRIKLALLYDFFSPRGTTTELTSLTMQGLPKHGRLVIVCAGGGCPFTRRAVSYSHSTTSLTGEFRSAALSADATVTFRVTAPYRVGDVLTLHMHGGDQPTVGKLCLPPGVPQPTACRS